MSVTAVNGQTPTMGLTHTNGLTPDGLVLYLQSQLEDIDGKINSFMAKQKTIQEQRKQLAAMSTVLAGVEVPVAKDSSKPSEYTTTTMSDVDETAFNAAWSKIETEFPLDKQTAALITDAKNTSFDNPEELKGIQSAIDNAIKDLESSASLDMIQLQSCMSQRNTAISLATNLMSAVGKGEESIAGNIGR